MYYKIIRDLYIPGTERQVTTCSENEDKLHFLFDCDSYHDLQGYNNIILYFEFLNHNLIHYLMMRNGYLFQL